MAGLWKVYRPVNVWDAAVERVRWVFDEFPSVAVAISGGKDSTVVYHIALAEAEKRDRLPLKCLFIDQEAEWQMTIDYIESIMSDPRVESWLIQEHLKMFNASSYAKEWLQAWDPERPHSWMRPKSENRRILPDGLGTDRFKKAFDAAVRLMGAGTALLSGMRASESVKRLSALCSRAVYKGETWGGRISPARGHYRWAPLYDWRNSDVWKAINDNKWPYCRLYDEMYRKGYNDRDMRVSNLHHEEAFRTLHMVHAIEPMTWEKLTKRMPGAAAGDHMSFVQTELPPIFRSWWEYRDYLVEFLTPKEAWRAAFRIEFAKLDEQFPDNEIIARAGARAVVTNDFEMGGMRTTIAAETMAMQRAAREAREAESERERSGAPTEG